MSDRGQQKEEMGRRGDAMDSSRQEGRMRKLRIYSMYSMREGKTADQSDSIDFAIECTDAQTS